MEATLNTPVTPTGQKKRCFVVMGFGVKTDYATGRKLDLNKSYRLLIKPVVESLGMECLRADEIRHSGVIDVPMYTELLNADVVIADLSTANVNAFYELGIRHALRPFSTVVISEDKLGYPFDLNHISITSYTHLGEGIEYEEVERFRNILSETLKSVLANGLPDSPVYTFLDQLSPPLLNKASDMPGVSGNPSTNNERLESETENKTLSFLIDQGEAAINKQDFDAAKAFFTSALLICHQEDNNFSKNDPYLLHRLALATYKSRKPDPITALHEGMKLLEKMDIENTNDPETVSIAGAIQKKFYELGHGVEHLYNAIMLFLRGYYLLNNRYNGINLAYMLNCRAGSSLCTTREEQVADMVYANHARIRLLNISEKELAQLEVREQKSLTLDSNLSDVQLQQKDINEQKFWIYLNRAEAYFGLGMFDEYHAALNKAKSYEHHSWMINGFYDQIDRLERLLTQYGYLLNPVWKAPAQ